MDTWSVSEVVLVPIMPSEQIAKVLAGMLTFGLADRKSQKGRVGIHDGHL